jgi:hypothetical protein
MEDTTDRLRRFVLKMMDEGLVPRLAEDSPEFEQMIEQERRLCQEVAAEVLMNDLTGVIHEVAK